MPRACSAALAAHLAGPATTICFLLKVTPKNAPQFGITTLDSDKTYDDGAGSVTYRAKRGYTAMDVETRSDLSVNNSEASGLLAEYPVDGATAAGIAGGDYDGAAFVQYLINYMDLSMGHVIVNSGQVGQVTNINDLTVKMEMRALTQILKQNTMVELTSVNCRAAFGDARCKLPFRWYSGTVTAVGAETDRDFSDSNTPGFSGAPSGGSGPVTDVPLLTGDGATTTAQLVDSSGNTVTSGFVVTDIKADGVAMAAGDYTVSDTGLVTFTAAPADGAAVTWDGTLPLHPADFFVPGVVQWLTGANAGRENEVESYDGTTGAVVLVIPVNISIAVGDTYKIRRDCAKSKAACIAYANIVNMRAEPELPVGTGLDAQAPTPQNSNLK